MGSVVQDKTLEQNRFMKRNKQKTPKVLGGGSLWEKRGQGKFVGGEIGQVALPRAMGREFTT